MIALFDFIPIYCPNCGNEIFLSHPPYGAVKDYNATASFTCKCGLYFQKANTDELLKAAEASGGDLANKLRAK